MCHNASLPQGDVDLQGLLALPNSLRERLDTWDEVGLSATRRPDAPGGRAKAAQIGLRYRS